MELGPIETEALSEFIKSRFKKIAVSISDELALKIATRVNGHPDYAQRLCSHILDGLEAKTVSGEFIEQGVLRMLSSLTPSLHKALSSLIKKDLIRKGKGREYYVADNFLHEWIRMVSK